MAGIGFELRKVIDRKGLTGLLKASISGTVIVAGPWLVSIIGISVIQRLLSAEIQEVPGAFTASVIYCYAFSLVIGGGIHYIFTRIISDYLYVNDQEAAFGYLLRFLLPVTAASLIVVLPAVLTMRIPVSHPLLYQAGTALLFTAVNILWLIMLFISVLKWYMKILFSFLLGMAASVGLLLVLGRPYGTGGAILGFALGHLIICILLLALSFFSFRPAYRPEMRGVFKRYLRQYRYLFLTGGFYYAGIWADKIINWIITGTRIPGTPFAVYEPYDITVYFANLSMIPGLVYFVVSTETSFFILLKKFLGSLGRGRFADIQRRKYRLISRAMKGLAEQCIFQGFITAGLLLAAPLIAATILSDTVTLSVVQLTVLAVFFHLLFLTLLNFLFYLEMYRRAFLSTLSFFMANIIIATVTALTSPDTLSGLGYLIAGITGSVVAFIAFRASIKKIDRLILIGLRY